MDPEVISALVGPRRDRGPLDDLTEREREIRALMAEGRSTLASASASSSARAPWRATCERRFVEPTMSLNRTVIVRVAPLMAR